jgi:hypothetical protein
MADRDLTGASQTPVLGRQQSQPTVASAVEISDGDYVREQLSEAIGEKLSAFRGELDFDTVSISLETDTLPVRVVGVRHPNWALVFRCRLATIHDGEVEYTAKAE